MILSVFQKKKRVFGYSRSNKKWWKPRFPMDYRLLVKWRIANFGIFLDILSFCVLDEFSVFQKIRFFGILGAIKHSGNNASRWIRDLWSKGVSLFFGIFLDVFEFWHL